MTPYELVFNKFLSKIESLDIAALNPEDKEEFLTDLLDNALSEIEVSNLKMVNDLSLRDNDLQMFEGNLYNSEVEAISLYMVGAWYMTKENSLENTTYFMGTKDQKATNQKDYSNMMTSKRKEYQRKARKYFRTYAYTHDDFKVGE